MPTAPFQVEPALVVVEPAGGRSIPILVVVEPAGLTSLLVTLPIAIFREELLSRFRNSGIPHFYQSC